jgi:hypothetical protein
MEKQIINTQIKQSVNDDLSGLKRKTWIKRMGLAAFLFFLIKGLVWLAIFFGIFKSLN